jgi:glutathione S-transferase
MKLYGHPWSVNTRKSLAAFAEKGHEPELSVVMLPAGEHKQPAYLQIHPFGKVPALDDGGFVLYEARAINAYVDAALAGPRLVPAAPRERARMDQWINVCDAYFTPFAQPLIVETLFRQFLGGEVDHAALEAGRAGISPALDALDKHLTDHAYVAGDAFTLADIHWMPYFEYLSRIGERAAIDKRPQLRAWWGRVSERPAWQRAARSGPQPYDPKVAAEVIARLRG